MVSNRGGIKNDVLVLYVHPQGLDAAAGTVDAPLASLGGARDRIRQSKARGTLPAGGAQVIFAAGEYPMLSRVKFDEQDSGTPTAPIVYQAAAGKTVSFTGGMRLQGFKPAATFSAASRIQTEVLDSVYALSLSEVGISDFGSMADTPKPKDPIPGLSSGSMQANRPELFFNGEVMSLARWPKDDFLTVGPLLEREPLVSHNLAGDHFPGWKYTDACHARWVDEPDAYLHGYWFWDWSDSKQRISAIDVEQQVITLDEPRHAYGYRSGQRYYAVNLLCELREPNEWYLDREAGVLYVLPSADPNRNEVVFTVGRELIELENAAHLVFAGLRFCHCRGNAVMLKACREVTLRGCTVDFVGSWGVRIHGGKKCTVVGCDFEGTGEGGIWLSGGDRATLQPSEHMAHNNVIHNFSRLVRTYRPAVNVLGVGNVVSRNLIYDAPHDAIQAMGNNHRIEGNEVHSVCYETGDVGAFYTGRDWTVRGIKITGNFFHDITGPGLHGAIGVYLDDAASGFTIAHNIMVNAAMAVLIGGGRDNLVISNLFIDCTPSIQIDARGVGWMRDHIDADGTLPVRLQAVPYRDALWAAAYPALAKILDDEPGLPKGNRVEGNITLGGAWANFEKKASPLVMMKDNLVNHDPGFANVFSRDFALATRGDAPAKFQIPSPDEIGVYADEARASWPVNHSIRKPDKPNASDLGWTGNPAGE